MLIYKEMAWLKLLSINQKYGRRKKIFVLDRENSLALQRKRYIEPIVKATQL